MPLNQREGLELLEDIRQDHQDILKLHRKAVNRSLAIGFVWGLIAAYCIDATLSLLW